MPSNLWNEAEAANFSGLELLAYRSRLLASDRTVINIFGGNTSSKLKERDHTGAEIEVLWVKGSGSDMADCTGKSFAGLKMSEVAPLIQRDDMSDEDMVEYLGRCAFEPGRPRQSIETLLHAFCPHPHVDHTHPDAVIALACTKRGEDAANELFGERMAWVDYIRPGFLLSKQIADAIAANPKAECVVMGKHGLVTWGETQKQCYDNTIRIIGEAESAITASASRTWTSTTEVTGGDLRDTLLPLRGAISKVRKHILRLDQSERVMQMANTPSASTLSQVGAACPDHLVHVKRQPLFCTPSSSQECSEAVDGYRIDYERYFLDNAAPTDTMFDSAPRVTLIPGFGMVTAGRDAFLAEVSQQLYYRAIEVIEGAEALGGYESLTANEAFGIEYWPLELYKLKQRPPERDLAGHIAFITGGGSGIGKATARRLAQEGAHVCITDLNLESAKRTADEVGPFAMAVQCDVTDEQSVRSAFDSCIYRWGGLDICVCSAGIASSAPIEDTSLADWEKNFAVLAKGYFLPSREAFRAWKEQGIGGSLIFVTSKNAIAAGKNASAYSAAKAAEQHLARCLAEEGGPIGVRVNSVLPDAVLSGSSIWDGEWRAQRAAAYGIAPEDLEEFYRNRTTLKQSVYPEDIAEAIAFLAGPRASKTTGAAITVDAGVPGVYVR